MPKSHSNDLKQYAPVVLLVAALVMLPVMTLRGPGLTVSDPFARWTDHQLADDVYEAWLARNATVRQINITIYDPAANNESYHLFRGERSGNWSGLRWRELGVYVINSTMTVTPGLFKAIKDSEYAGLAAVSPGLFANIKGPRFFLTTEGQRFNLGVLS